MEPSSTTASTARNSKSTSKPSLQSTPPHPQAHQPHPRPGEDGQKNRRAVDDTVDAEEELDHRVPEEHGLSLDAPGALGEDEEVDVHEEGAGGRCAQAKANLREEDPEAHERVHADEVKEATGGAEHDVGLGVL